MANRHIGSDFFTVDNVRKDRNRQGFASPDRQAVAQRFATAHNKELSDKKKNVQKSGGRIVAVPASSGYLQTI